MSGTFFHNILMQTTPAVGKPWQENWVIDAISIGTAIFLIALVWLWARSGRSKADNEVPFDHTAEGFAGTAYAGYGPLPIFLTVVYVVVILAMIGYTVISIINGPQY
jgi:NADH:ubiquinone oxidoreductase subunit 6 (subunit J)